MLNKIGLKFMMVNRKMDL